MRICLLASGSKGNSIYIETGESRILVDAGCSAREIIHRLSSIGVDSAGLDAVLISHEHNDHIRGAGALARKLKIPLLLSYPTSRESRVATGKTEVVEFESGYQFTFRDILIDPFPITHDACDPVGFVIESREGRIGIATDLGIATRLVSDKMKDCRALVLEANHDHDMLQNGPYPWHLKQRIKSRHGHLSNLESAELLEELLHQGLEGVFLAHLSEVNNDPAMALEAATNLLNRQNTCDPQILVGEQQRVSGVLSI